MGNVRVFVADSLSTVMKEIAHHGRENEHESDLRNNHPAVDIITGSSGGLRNRIERGNRGEGDEGSDEADIFISANLEHSRQLANQRHDGDADARVMPFARNQLCALTHTRLKAAAANILDLMLDHRITLGTSIPGEDPAGDDAWTLFHRAEILRPGSELKLSEKAAQISGNKSEGSRPDYKHLLESGEADIFLTYRTDVLPLVKHHEGLDAVRLPDVLRVESDQSLIVLNDESAAAWQFAMKFFSVTGRQILAKHGFLRPSAPKISQASEIRMPNRRKPTAPMYIPATTPSKN